METATGNFTRGFRSGFGMAAAAENAAYTREARERDRLLREARAMMFAADDAAPAAAGAAPGSPAPVAPGAAPTAEGMPAAAPAAPGVPAPAAAPTSPAASNLDKLNRAVERGFKLVGDPKYSAITGELYDNISTLSAAIPRIQDALHREVVTRAAPLVQRYRNDGLPKEEREKAAGELLTQIFPDGRQYTAKFSDDGAQVTLEAPGMDPQTMPVLAFDQTVRDGLSTPAGLVSLIQGSIDAQIALQTKLAEEGRAEKRDLEKEKRAERRALGKEERAAERSLQKDARKYFIDQMKRYDDNLALGVYTEETMPRAEYERRARAAAESLASGGTGGSAPPGGDPSGAGVPPPAGRFGAPGQVIEVDTGTPAPAAPAAPTTPPPVAAPAGAPGAGRPPPVPRPGGAAPVTGGVPPPSAGPTFNYAPPPAQVAVEGTGFDLADKAGMAVDAVAGSAKDLATRAGGAVARAIPTAGEMQEGYIKDVRSALKSDKVNRLQASRISVLASSPDKDLKAMGFSVAEIRRIREYDARLRAPAASAGGIPPPP